MLLVAIIIAIIAYQHYDRMRKIEIIRISQPAPEIPKGGEKLPEPVKPTPVKPTPVKPTPGIPRPWIPRQSPEPIRLRNFPAIQPDS